MRSSSESWMEVRWSAVLQQSTTYPFYYARPKHMQIGGFIMWEIGVPDFKDNRLGQKDIGPIPNKKMLRGCSFLNDTQHMTSDKD